MRVTYLALFIILMASIQIGTAQNSSSHFPCISGTGNNATVILPAGAEPRIKNALMAAGDEIGVFGADGKCVGRAVWQEKNLAITVWGDNTATSEVDGMVGGERMHFRVWRKSEDQVYRFSIVGLEEGAPQYASNGIYVVKHFEATDRVPAPALLGPDNGSSSVTLEASLKWEDQFDANRYDVEVATDAQFSGVARSFSGVEDTVVLLSGLEPGTTYFWRVRAIADGEPGYWSSTGSFTTVSELSSDQEMGLPTSITLHQNYPNPFNPSTVIPFDLPEASAVRIAVYDVLGREVTVLTDGLRAAGRHTISWQADAFPGGTYFYVMQVDGKNVTQRMTLVK